MVYMPTIKPTKKSSSHLADHKLSMLNMLHGEQTVRTIERWNDSTERSGTERKSCGDKKIDTSILTGYQIFHNYVRPHESLDGKTPAEACGIRVEGENKWITLIQNASHHPTVNRETNHPQT